ncbi:MAG TPA: hypothetical protein VE869_12825 [Gemmatimonas sp.]|nr:hypothetical protein [Gemmatimonas sp.]
MNFLPDFTPAFDLWSLSLSALLVALLVLTWNVVLAGWIASRRDTPRPFTALTGFCGLLIAPALVVAIATGTEAASRTVNGISWLLPVISCAFVLQVMYAMAMRLISPVVAVPILLYDVAVAAIAIGDYLVLQKGSAPLGLQAAVAARDTLIGMTVGRAALVSPFALIVPMIAPAYPARWRLSAAVRAVLVLGATAVTTLLALEWPRGIGAVRGYTGAYGEPMQARPAGDFSIGMRLFPVLDGPPQARVVASDLAMARTFGPDIVLLVLDEDGTRASALDSLSRVLQPLRADSVRVAVALAMSRVTAPQRDAAIERVLLRVRPDVLFPAHQSALPGIIRGTVPSAASVRAVLMQASRTVTRVRPRTRVAWAAARLDATDSLVYAWAAMDGSPVDVLAAMTFPSFSGLPAVDARLRALDRWHSSSVTRGHRYKPHWLANVGGLPHAHGDAAQLAAMRRALAWASRRQWVTAAIVGEAADYDGWVGMRAANGRQRVAFAALAAAASSMRDIRPTEARPLSP